MAPHKMAYPEVTFNGQLLPNVQPQIQSPLLHMEQGIETVPCEEEARDSIIPPSSHTLVTPSQLIFVIGCVWTMLD